jgi:hypothetical protein
MAREVARLEAAEASKVLTRGACDALFDELDKVRAAPLHRATAVIAKGGAQYKVTTASPHCIATVITKGGAHPLGRDQDGDGKLTLKDISAGLEASLSLQEIRHAIEVRRSYQDLVGEYISGCPMLLEGAE